MVKTKKYSILRIIIFIVLIIVAGLAAFSLWLTHHYRALLRERLPLIVATATDSLYHISFTDIRISYVQHDVSITGIELTPDTARARELRGRRQRIPTTLSRVSIPVAQISGIVWGDIIDKHSFSCTNIDLQRLKWKMVATPHPEDSTFPRKEKKEPYLAHITAAHFTVTDPDISYQYKGPQSTFQCFMKGGKVDLEQWAYNFDERVDTSVFLYAHSGKVRFNSFELLKPTGKYNVQKPLIDFTTSGNVITLQNVHIPHMTNRDPKTGKEKEVYDLKLPEIALTGLNWNKLINHNTLAASMVKAARPEISVRYIRAADNNNSKMGSYPHQLLLQVALQTYIKQLDISGGHIRYAEITNKGDEGIIEFTGISGAFSNVTNIDSIIAVHKSCVIKLKGKFMNKSPIDVTFNLGLADKKGRFTLDGSLKDLDGDDVLKQTQAFTIVEVTSFHLSEMDMHEEGDESYVKGAFGVKYEDLKISLLKFKSDKRKGKHGPLSFLGSALLLFPANPMPGKEVRSVTTTFARDPAKGFISMIWKNIYYGAKKTAMRSDKLLVLTDGRETTKGDPPAPKGFFKRLFGKKR